MSDTNNDITFWNRLDSRARHKDFFNTLKAEVRDPLWMLSRQWQFGEFEAEDAGSPVFARIDWNNTRLDKLSLNQGNAHSISEEIPLEAEVERVETEPDLYLRIEMGRHFIRLLNKHLPEAKKAPTIQAFRAKSQFQFAHIPDHDKTDKYDNAYLLNNDPLLRFIDATIFGKMLDGKALFDALKSGSKASSLIGQNDAAIDAVGNAFVEWFKRRYSQPDNVHVDGWIPERLEYEFAAAAPKANNEKALLVANEYFQGRLDWYSFDLTGENSGAIPPSLKKDLDPDLVDQNKQRHFIPSEIIFPGMPKARWWEFEDRKLNFAAIEANISDSAKMVLTEFAFLYSNDWFMLPFRVPVGSLVELKQITLTDSFGQRTLINHYNQADNAGNALDPNWALFKLNNDALPLSKQTDRHLLVPPVILDLQESKPIEEVNFTRDEMANFVWAIETIVPDGLGKGINGTEYAQKMQTFFAKLIEEFPVPDIEAPENGNNTADIRYQLANSVPENWIPFIPRHKNASTFTDIHFQRAAMPRILPGFPAKRVRPVTRILRYGLDLPVRQHYFICEEEIPRAGAFVRASWQRARWHNGKVALWYGYRKTNGRGESASGLKFDLAVDKKF